MTSTLATPYVHPSLAALGSLGRALAASGDWTPDGLGRLTRLLAATAADALRRTARHDTAARWYLRLALTDEVEVWLLTWTAGQGTGAHDHGGASGAYTVLAGELTETWRDGPVRSRRAVLAAGSGATFGPERVHTVANPGTVDASSVHAYSPPLLPLGESVDLEEPPG